MGDPRSDVDKTLRFPVDKFVGKLHLTSGELDLVRRALRYYISGEQRAVQEAACFAKTLPNSAKHKEHAADVKRQADAHMDAAHALLEKLRTDDAVQACKGDYEPKKGSYSALWKCECGSKSPQTCPKLTKEQQ